MDNIIEYKGYYAVVKYRQDVDHGVLIGKVLYIPELICFQAKDTLQLKAKFMDIVSGLDYAKNAEKRGEKCFEGFLNNLEEILLREASQVNFVTGRENYIAYGRVMAFVLLIYKNGRKVDILVKPRSDDPDSVVIEKVTINGVVRFERGE